MYKVIEDATGHRATPGVVATSSYYAKAFKEKKLELAVGLLGNISWAIQKRGVWKDLNFTEGRLIAAGSPFMYVLVARDDSGIETVADMKGKNIIGGQKGSMSVAAAWDALLYAADLKPEDVNFLPFSSSTEMLPAIREKRAHAAIWFATESMPWVVEMALTEDVHLVSLTEEQVKKAAEREPAWGIRSVIKAGTYKGQDKDILTFGQPNSITVRSTLHPDVVYAITSAMYDRIGEMISYWAEFDNYQAPASINTGLGVLPMHEGAIRYWKDRGYWKASHDEQQAATMKALGLN